MRPRAFLFMNTLFISIAYIFPFFLSTIVGSILAVTLYRALDKRGIVQDIK